MTLINWRRQPGVSRQRQVCFFLTLCEKESVALLSLRVLTQWSKIIKHPLPNTRCGRLEFVLGAMRRKIEKTGLPVRVMQR